MSTIAFYAPMKPPTHPTPSGDREVARGLLKALGDNNQGWSVKLVSTFRTYDGAGIADIQDALKAQAATKATDLIKQGRREGWRVWFTYHNYYKAPDLIGPKVSKALNIPYVLLEATRAKKRLDGPWADFAHKAEAACDHADVILYFTQRDRDALETHRTPTQSILQLPPFLAQSDLTTSSRMRPIKSDILSVGMMRTGAKLESYALIVQTLTALKTQDWRLNIAGDGPARTEVELLLKPFGKQVIFLGQLDKTELAQHYATSAVFLWPGVDEAFGMVYLEAQAAGLPIVAQNRPSIRDVIAPSTKLPPIGAAHQMAQEIDKLFKNNDYWQNRSQAGIAYIKQRHLLEAATKKLQEVFSTLIGPDA